MTKLPAFCTQCRSRCGCLAVVEGGRLVAVEPDPAHPTGAKLCPKGRAAPELVHHPDRLRTPMRRTRPKGDPDPGWQPLTWDEALDTIASRLSHVRERHGPEQVAFSVTTPSGAHMQDGIAWVERFVRAYGSPNTIYATEICNWHKDHATRFTFGHDIGTPDFARTDCVLLWGNNPAVSWLARVAEIQGALRRGARMIVVDPQPIAFARQAHCWLQLRPGTDQALALGLAHLLIESGRFDQAFMLEWSNGPLLVRSDTGLFLRESDLHGGGREHIAYGLRGDGHLLPYDMRTGVWPLGCEGLVLRGRASPQGLDGPLGCRTAFEAYAEVAAQWEPRRVAAVTGVPLERLQEAAQILGDSPSVAYYAWNGIGQSVTATQTDRALTLLYALTGSVGKAGGNVPGAAARFGDIGGGDLVVPAQRAKALGLERHPIGPGLLGYVTARDVYRAVLQQQPYPVRALVSFGTNLIASQPDTLRARQALERLEFHVHADFFLNPSAEYADIVLPVATSWEREGLRAGFDTSLAAQRHVQWRPAVVAPVGESRSDVDIVLALAGRLGMADAFFGLSSEAGHDAILAPAGLTVAQLRASPRGITLPGEVPLEAHKACVQGVPRGFATPTRRVEVYAEQMLRHGAQPLPRFDPADLGAAPTGSPLRLCASKTVAYCHSQLRHIASLRRLLPDPVLEMAPEAAAPRGIANGDWVRIETPVGTALARAHLWPGLAPDTVVAQHGWWVRGDPGSPTHADGMAANLNGVMDTSHEDPVSGSVPLRAGWCEVRRV